MSKLKVLAVLIAWAMTAWPLLHAGDLSRYREFELDSNLLEVAKQVDAKVEDAKIIHERPALIQELSWRAGSDDAVKQIQFRFYRGDLFRMVVHYNRYNTQGLTAQDLIDATSAIYGEALRPTAEIAVNTIYGSNEAAEVIARWEDADWSYNLVRLKFEPSFTLAVFSKRLDSLARAAIDEAIELDMQEAPQREIAEKRREEMSKTAELEKARQANKPRFRP
ncbi:MAG: hypothetical protein JSU96_03625 [Acidobacteriota bacterium]|nr:MAG: hypothetical protein JSU96_03625 [Acidobacteriota bacterium]